MKRYKSKEGQELIHETYDRLLDSWNVIHERQDILTSY